MSTDTAAPSVPVKAKRTMSEEHKRKLAEGRARAAAEKKIKDALNAPSSGSGEGEGIQHVIDGPTSFALSDPRDAVIAELKAKVDALLAGKMPAADIAALPTQECIFEYRLTGTDENGNRIPTGHSIRSLDDPKWDELAKTSVPLFGSIVVHDLIRNERGEIIERRQTHGQQMPNWHMAREMMERVLRTGKPYEKVVVA